MNKIIQNNLHAVIQLCKNHHVNELYAFGSICTNNFGEHSDIDLLVSFKELDYAVYAENYFNFADKLEQIFKRKVDLVTTKSLSNPYFIKTMEKTKINLYAAA